MMWLAVLATVLSGVSEEQEISRVIPLNIAHPDARPFESFGAVDTVTVEYWCRFGARGYPDCTASTTDPITLRPDAGDWLETRISPRPDYMEAGLKRRFVYRWRRDSDQVEGVTDGRRRLGFVGERLEGPDWEVRATDVDPIVGFDGIREASREELKGVVPMSCGVRADGYLSLCISERPVAQGLESTRFDAAARVAANLRVRMSGAGEAVAPGTYVQVEIELDPARLGGSRPRVRQPRVTSSYDSMSMTAVYPHGARMNQQGGNVAFECTTPAETGPLENCTVIGDTNPRWGFVAPSFDLIRQTVTAPYTINGRPVRTRVRQLVRWEVPRNP